MMNTALLKQTLSEKMATSTSTIAGMHNPIALTEQQSVLLSGTTLRINFTFTVPFHEAHKQLEQIQQLLSTLEFHNVMQNKLQPLLLTTSSMLPAASTGIINHAPQAVIVPLQIPDKINTKGDPSATGNRRNHFGEPITVKQQKLIRQLIAKQHLDTDAVKNLLREKYGVDDDSHLSKRVASDLINFLIGR